MNAKSRAVIGLSGGVLLAFILFGAVAIYGFDYFESAWGRGPSLQVYVWIGIGLAILSCMGAAVGFSYGSRMGNVPRTVPSCLGGALSTLIVLAVGAFTPRMSDIGLPLIAVGFFLLSVGGAYASCRLTRHSGNLLK